jgi:hypothetical protein
MRFPSVADLTVRATRTTKIFVARTFWSAIVMLVVATPASAQIDLSGEWAPRFYEDQPERVPGPDLGDYLGIPISDAARWRAEAWSASIMTLPEWQCRPHSADYIWRGPSPVVISKEVDPVSREITSFKLEWLRSVERAIYLDGRKPPSDNAPHTWAGFSVGKWTGDILTVTTTHLKEGYVRRNGLPRSDQATLTEHFIRNGDVLTVVTIVTDPVYLTEPFIRTTDYELDLKQQNPPYPCHVVEEIDRPKGTVPHIAPGTNQSVQEFATKHNVPADAARGGAATMYPVRVTAAKTMAETQTALRPGVPVDLTGQWVSVVTEDWRWRMVTAPKGDYASVPLNAEGVKTVNAWDPAKDEAAGQQCRAYGAGGIMRMPGQIRVAWQDDRTLKVDTEAGSQTRVFHFGGAALGDTQASWQGVSSAQWQYAGRPARGGGARPAGGSLRVTTTRLLPGYLRKNGVPYGANTRVTEYLNRVDEPNGDSWLIVTTLVEDPQYLGQRFVTSSHFKKVADGSPWNPAPCSAR